MLKAFICTINIHLWDIEAVPTGNEVCLWTPGCITTILSLASCRRPAEHSAPVNVTPRPGQELRQLQNNRQHASAFLHCMFSTHGSHSASPAAAHACLQGSLYRQVSAATSPASTLG